MVTPRLALLFAIAGFCVVNSACKRDDGPDPITTTHFTCADSASGSQIACSLNLTSTTGFTVTLDTSSCDRHGNSIRLISPIDSTLTSDACYAAIHQTWSFPGPFTAGTHVAMEVVSNVRNNPPSLRVTGSYPTWHAVFEDGYDNDFNDLFMTIQADSAP